ISSSFAWDADGDDGDDWGDDNITASSPAPGHPVEDESTRQKREHEKLEKQEQLRQKRDQKQQEMQAKREAQRQQLAEKQLQKKGTSNALKLGVTKVESALTAAPASTVPTPSSVGPATTTMPSKVVEQKPISKSFSKIQLPEGSADEKDDWD